MKRRRKTPGRVHVVVSLSRFGNEPIALAAFCKRKDAKRYVDWALEYRDSFTASPSVSGGYDPVLFSHGDIYSQVVRLHQ